ncbi:MAG: hypothetical protein V4599_13635 [Verrucomicrobiota bacterium]
MWLGISLLIFMPAMVQADGKHLEVMAPLCRQNDFHGKPHLVTESSFESPEGDHDKLESVKRSEYDKDGNAIRVETFDSSNRKTDSEIYTYDEGGTWVSLVELSEGTQTAFQIFVDLKTKRIAKVDQRSKNTEFISYSEQGFELGSITQTIAGKTLEKTTFRRNALNKEEHVLFEEPIGKKTSEFIIQWLPEGFERTSTIIMHDKDGDQFVMTYEYPEIDSAGNWLTQIEKSVLILKNGEKRSLPTVTNKRKISYYP